MRSIFWYWFLSICFLQLIGLLILGSVFEDIVYQVELCLSSSLQGALARPHNNIARAVRTILSVALERILVTRSLVKKKPKLPKGMKCFSQNLKLDVVGRLLPSIETLLIQYNDYRKDKDWQLTLEQLEGVGGQFDPSTCGFLKSVSSKERVKPWFFVTFNIIISDIFPENFIGITQVVRKIWGISLSILAKFHRFSSIFWIFWHFLVTKKLMMSAYNRWC